MNCGPTGLQQEDSAVLTADWLAVDGSYTGTGYASTGATPAGACAGSGGGFFSSPGMSSVRTPEVANVAS